MIADLRRVRGAPNDFPPVVLVTLSDVDQTTAFLDTRWPQVPAIADPAKVANVKPPASRSDSSEKFVVATGFRG